MKHWKDDRGKRWYTTEHVRVTRLFRYHVTSRHNPRGRIARLICQFCPPNTQTTISQFHHVDYSKPFRGVWVCVSCHRKLEAGSLTIKPSLICDYTELVRPVLKPKLSSAMRDRHSRLTAHLTETPF